MASEQVIQSKIIKRLEKEGYYVIKLITTNKNGIPDLIAIKPKGNGTFDVKFIEVKKPDKKPSPLQVYRMSELEKFGIPASVEYE